MKPVLLIAAAVIALAACGNGDTGDAAPDNAATAAQPAAAGQGSAAPTGPMTTRDWYSVDHDAETVHMTITAGAVPDHNYWNFNGHIKGALAITVPEGYTVTIEFVNQDPAMAHSVGISSELADFMMPPAPNPVFEGAITENPQSMVDGTMPGETETIRFLADTAGNYSMVCYVTGHTAVGMWLYFNVSARGEAGVQGP